jgi:serine/threonine-protein kinase
VTFSIAVAPPAAGTVPDLSGLSGDQASDAVAAAGFKPKVVRQTNADVAAGFVIDQNPAAGVQAAPGSTVTIVVSSGPAPVEVPSVTTKTQTDATNTLTNAGFKVTVTLATGGGPVGTVTAQSPGAGTLAAPGSTVVITVAQ